MRACSALLLLLVSGLVWAGEFPLSCTDPTENEDGTPLTDLAGIKIYEGSVSGGPYVEVEDVANCDSIPVQVRPAGTYYLVGTAYNVAGIESVYSNEVEKVVDPSAPNPPFNLTAGVDTVAYAIQQVVTGGTQSLTIYPVGLVDEVTVCDPYIKVSNASHPNGLSLIQKDDVTFAPGADANTVYAECGAG